MKIPEEFVQFVCGIYPEDDPPESASLESVAAAALAGTPSHDRGPLLAFLNELLDGSHSDAELEYVWRKQSPRSSFSPGGHRIFFEEIRRQIIADKDRKLARARSSK